MQLTVKIALDKYCRGTIFFPYVKFERSEYLRQGIPTDKYSKSFQMHLTAPPTW
jgi:hypothetical protein